MPQRSESFSKSSLRVRDTHELLPLPLAPYVWADDFDPGLLHTFPVLHKRRTKHGKKPDLLDCVCAFDIESTNIDEIEQAVMYISCIISAMSFRSSRAYTSSGLRRFLLCSGGK